MIGGEQEGTVLIEHDAVINNDLSAKDLHCQADHYFENSVEQSLFFSEYIKGRSGLKSTATMRTGNNIPRQL